jgi:asparagine synthase (glutamine-hydrolysing)
LRENGIAQGDRLGMASSVEMRLPLVDYKFVETVVGLRKTQSDSKLPPKHWFKEAVKDLLPDWVLNRPKRGFAPPTRKWHDALFAAYGDSLLDGYLVESDILSRESGLHLAKGDFPIEAVSPLSFKALVLEQWCRQMRNTK